MTTIVTGHKKDTWIAIDMTTGAKIQTLSSDGTQKMCPSSAEKVIYIGRTEYTINMFDSKTGSKRYGNYGCYSVKFDWIVS